MKLVKNAAGIHLKFAEFNNSIGWQLGKKWARVCPQCGINHR